MPVARLVAELLLPEVWCSCHGSSDFGRRLFQLCVATLLQRCQLCCLIGMMCLPKVGFRMGGGMVFFQSVDFFFLQKEVSASFIRLERKLLKEGNWSSWCCTFYMKYWSWDSLVASFWLFVFGDLDLPSQPTSKDSLWIHDINLFQTTTGLTSKPWVNTNQMLGVVRSIGKDAHFLKPQYCEWKFASDVYRHSRHTILTKWERHIELPYFFHTLQPWGFIWLDQCRINCSFGEL